MSTATEDEGAVGFVDRSEALFMSRGNLPLSVNKADKHSWTAVGNVGDFMRIGKERLKVDKRYQRALIGKPQVLDIARKWDWALCGVLLVVLRPDGTYWVVDGQHRWIASSYRKDVNELPCMVFSWDDLGSEARAFIGANTMKTAVGALDRHKASLVAKKSLAISVEWVIKKHGYSFVASSRGSTEGRTIQAVATIYSLVRGDEGNADRTLALCAEISGGHHLPQALLLGVGYIGEKDSAIFRSPHRRRLVDLGLGVITAEIQRHRLLSNKGGSKVYAGAILQLVNKGRRTKKLLSEMSP